MLLKNLILSTILSLGLSSQDPDLIKIGHWNESGYYFWNWHEFENHYGYICDYNNENCTDYWYNDNKLYCILINEDNSIIRAEVVLYRREDHRIIYVLKPYPDTFIKGDDGYIWNEKSITFRAKY